MSANQAWTDFWAAIGDGFVPELPLADLPRADRAAALLARAEPEGWRAWIVAAQLHLLRGNHAKGQDAIDRSIARCRADPGCASAASLLKTLLTADQFSNFDRVVAVDAIRSKGHGFDISKTGSEELPRLDAALKHAATTWFAASRVRWIRAGFQAFHYAATAEEQRRLDATADAQLEPLGDNPLIRLLRWSIHPTLPLPTVGKELEAAAALLQADRLLAPNGGAFGLDVHVTGSAPDHATWFAEGLQSPLEATPSIEDVTAARALIDAASGSQGGSMLVPICKYLSAYANVSIGKLAIAETEIEDAWRGFHELAAASAEASSALFSAAIHLEKADLAATLGALRSAVELTEHSGSPGRGAAVLGAAGAMAEEAFHLAQKYRIGAELTSAAADLAAEHGYLDQALQLATDSVNLVQALALDQQVLRRAPRSHRVCDAVTSGYERYGQEQKLSGQQLEMMVNGPARSVAGAHASIAYSEAYALAHLGARSSLLKERLDAFAGFANVAQLSGPGTSSDAFVSSSRLTIEIAEHLAREDFDSAAGIAQSAGMTDMVELVNARRGRPIAPTGLEIKINDAETAIQEALNGKERLLKRYLNVVIRRQDLAAKRERYIAVCELLREPHQARKVWNNWVADPFSGAIAQSMPFRPLILEGQVLAAEANGAAAATHFEQAIELLRSRAASGERRNLHLSVAASLPNAYGGRARAALALGDAATALDRIDELRWMQQQQTIVDHTAGKPPALDLATLGSALGQDVTVLVIADLGVPNSLEAWLWSSSSLRSKSFADATNGISMPRALALVSIGQSPSGSAKDLADWLDAGVPRDKPLVLAVGSRLRAAGLHVLPVGGEPLALRNPILYAPSLRTLATLLAVKPGTGDRVVIGMPVTADASREAIGELTPLASESELRGLAGDRLLWNNSATVKEAMRLMPGARRIHVSCHGRVDELDAANTGLVLYGGEILNPLVASELRLSGPLVVLSACQSLQTHPFASSVPVLDTAFLIAGARAVVSTPLNVAADAATAWMQSFHGTLDQKQSIMAAAREAYRATRVRFPDAEKWGAFSVVGAATGTA